MKNRDKIKSALILFIEEDMRNECTDKRISSKKSIDEFIQISKNKIEQSAEIIIQEYENHLLKRISDEIILSVKENLDQNKLSIKDLVTGLLATVNQNHSNLFNNISGISELQRRIRMQILEEEIEAIQLDLGILRKHQQTLDKIAKHESRKVSWMFVLIAFASIILWSILIYKFHWDNMEKWTYISAAILVLLNAIYFAIFERNFNSQNLKNEKYEKIKTFNYSLHKFDTAFLARIEHLLENKKNELKNLSHMNSRN